MSPTNRDQGGNPIAGLVPPGGIASITSSVNVLNN